MSNSGVTRGIRAILLNKRLRKPRLKSRSFQLKLWMKDRRIKGLEVRVKRLESEVEAYRRSCRALGHQMGKNRLNKEIFDLLVNGDFTGSTSCAHESIQSGRECEQIIRALKEAALNMPKLSPYPPAGDLFERDDWPYQLGPVVTEIDKSVLKTNAMFAAFISCDKGPEEDGKP